MYSRKFQYDQAKPDADRDGDHQYGSAAFHGSKVSKTRNMAIAKSSPIHRACGLPIEPDKCLNHFNIWRQRFSKAASMEDLACVAEMLIFSFIRGYQCTAIIVQTV